jgi:hypothetical protein
MMQGQSLFSELAAAKVKAEDIAEGVPSSRIPLAAVFEGFSDRRPRVKFGCAKALLLLSEKHPELLLDHIDTFAGLLDCENRIFKWNAIAILGNLAAVDTAGRIRKLLKKLFGFLAAGELITANNTIAALCKIARAVPGEKRRIVAQLIGVERQTFETEECRNIAIGKAILALGMLCDPAKTGKSVIDFAGRQTANTRKATAHKAKAFVAKHKPSY